jgi:hypothetical protein
MALPELQKRLVEHLSNYRDSVSIFKTSTLPESKVVAETSAWVSRMTGQTERDEPADIHVREGKKSSVLFFPEGIRAKVYHASNAVVIKRGYAPMDHLIRDDQGTDYFTEQCLKIADRLALETRRVSEEETLEFEKLWRIKGNGVTLKGEVGKPVLCRVVGAFRRTIQALPVWGGASCFVQLAAEGAVASLGVDWRAIEPEVVDKVAIRDPLEAAAQVVATLEAKVPGFELVAEDWLPEQFSLGYFSLPKGRSQGYLQPVYVARLRSTGWTSLNHMIVLPAALKQFEPLERCLATPPLTTRVDK